MLRAIRKVMLASAVLCWGCLATIDHGDDWPCSTDDDCVSPLACRYSGARMICMDRYLCRDTWDCDSGRICMNSQCIVPGCTDEDPSTCEPYGCIAAEGACRTECASQSDCYAGYGCRNAECIASNCDTKSQGQCGGLRCENGVCLTACRASSDCEGNAACVHAQCTPTPGIGDTCASNKPCPAGECVSGVCITTHSLCEGRACGTEQGVSCGSCAAKQYCDEASKCQDACGNALCGTLHGISCGECTGKDYCTESGQCEDACGDAVCGTLKGVDCGKCSGKYYCDPSGQCVDACGDANCGSLHGVSCGKCVSGQSCDTGHHCAQQICTPSERYCEGKVRHLCSTDGLAQSVLETCGPGKCCSPEQCVGPLCTPGMLYCSASKVLGKCATDGCGPEAGGTDCAAQGAECSVDLGCVHVDTLGTGGNESPNSCYGGGYAHQSTGVILQATKSVQLLRFSQKFYVKNEQASMRWVVYEANALGSAFAQIYSEYTAVQPTQMAGEEVVSNVMTVNLTAGRYYYIGTECTDSWDCYAFANNAVSLSKDPSFGTVKYNMHFQCSPLGTSFFYDVNYTYHHPLDFVIWTKP